MADFSHLNEHSEGQMVDISGKAVSHREALVSGEVQSSQTVHDKLKPEALEEIIRTAKIASVMATKKTADLVPYCHQVPISKVETEISYQPDGYKFHILVKSITDSQTGVEMEAFVGANMAAITIYDMLKAVDPGVTLGPFKLQQKSGGKLGQWKREP